MFMVFSSIFMEFPSLSKHEMSARSSTGSLALAVERRRLPPVAGRGVLSRGVAGRGVTEGRDMARLTLDR